MKTKKILVCDGSVDGIFTAVYKAYDLRYGHDNIKIVEGLTNATGESLELFAEYIDVPTDYELSAKVGQSIRTKICREVYEILVRAALSNQIGRSDVIYRYIILAFHVGKEIMDYLSNDVVNQIYNMNRNVSLEVHHYNGFVRFQEVNQSMLLSVIRPKNNIITLLADHFVDRLQGEDFCIVDEGRKIAVIHPRMSQPTVIDLSEEDLSILNKIRENEKGYEDLWKAFVNSISIKERENLKLQRNNLPLRFRNHMTEFR